MLLLVCSAKAEFVNARKQNSAAILGNRPSNGSRTSRCCHQPLPAGKYGAIVGGEISDYRIMNAQSICGRVWDCSHSSLAANIGKLRGATTMARG